MKNFFLVKLSQPFFSVCFGAVIVVLCVCCSKDEMVSPQVPSSEEKIVPYDSVYNATYNLFVVNNDTTAYNPQDYNTPLTFEEKEVSKSLNEYAVKMLSDYSSTNSENTILSPFNASMLYSLMANFADEKKDENVFKESIGVSSVKSEVVNSFFRKFNNIKSRYSEQDGNKEQMSYASTLWMDKNASVYKSFLSTTKFYGFGVKGMDLNQESTVEAVNNFVHSNMDSNDALINKASIEKSKPLVTSSMSFKGEWKEKFHVDSAQTNLFANSNGSKTLCKVLRATHSGRYSSFNAFDMIEIPYKGGSYSMYVLLPHAADGLSRSLAELSQRGVVQCMDLVSDTTRTFHGEYLISRDTTTLHGTYTVVDTLITDTVFDVRIPKFKLCASTGLNPRNVAGNAATRLMYQTNLPKVSPNGYSLSNVFQSCSFEVNEQSTSASSEGLIMTGGNNSTPTHNYSIITGHTGQHKEMEPKGNKIRDIVVVPFHTEYPFAVFIRENEIGTIPFACSIKTLDF